MKTISITFILVAITLLVLNYQPDSVEDGNTDSPKQELLLYSGITMVRPLQKLADQFSEQHNVKVKLVQGASGFLFDTLTKQQSGDIYFPGSPNFRKSHLQENLFASYVLVGYNRLAIITPKNNPKQLNADLKQLTNPELSVVISSPEASSVGRATELALRKLGIANAVYENVTYFTTDSHRIFTAIRSGHADIAVNWYATSKWPETVDYMDALIIDNKISPKRDLELNLLRFSKNPELALEFMRFASSPAGLQVFADYGFLTPEEQQQFKQNPPQIISLDH
ncbi:molybdate transport system substrate-binding protein [uncultured Thiomicrorhabdus sp.]